MENSDQIEKENQAYHRNISRVQLHSQELKEEVRADNRTHMDYYADLHPDLTAEEITEMFNEQLEADLLQISVETKQIIEAETLLYQDRLQKILKHS